MHQLNAAFYCFAPLNDLAAIKREWLGRLKSLGLHGTIILAPEGLNGSLAGPPQALRDGLLVLRSFPGLEDLRCKESPSEHSPFRKLCIKLKKEIVTFRQPAVSPPPKAASRLAPRELALWIAEKRDLVLLDTRNAYESALGTFEGAHTLPLDHFVDFAAAVSGLPEEWKRRPIVTFCTGGIRCEKAAPYLASLGFEQVFQLDDGILGYFEKVGAAHWRGECFVFDERVSLGPDLQPAGARLCRHCQGPVPRSASACIHCGRDT